MIRVLIVDDDKLALRGLRTTMPWEQYDMQVVGEAENGQKALEFLAKNPVDLAIVDLAMPVMDGLTLIRECNERYPEMLYVVMTFHENFEYVQEALRLGVMDYISKLKLESEDYDRVFSRIQLKLRANAQHVRSGNVDNTLTERFRQPLWLYDDLCMDVLEANILQSDLSAYDLECIIMESILRIESTAGIQRLPIPALADKKAAMSFLRAYRKHAAMEAKRGIDTTEARMLVVADFVNTHFSEPIHVEDMGTLVNLSRSYLSNCFKKSLGITLNDFLRRKRVREAAELIRSTAQPLQQIANQVGYENYRHFKEVFREQMGSSPQQFRERHRNTEGGY